MNDPWPMIAGIGAGVAAAAAVGQMIVAAVALGAQDANSREVEELQRKLERMQKMLAEKGYLDEDTTKARQAKQTVANVDSYRSLVHMQQELDRKIKDGILDNSESWRDDGGGATQRSTAKRQPAQKGWFTKLMEDRGRRELGL